MLAVNEDEDALFDAIKAGAAAFILKDVGPDDLVTIIRRVFAGEYLINDKVFAKPAVASRVLKEFRELAVYGQEAAPIFAPLSPREVEILDNIAQGMTNKQVAYALSISEQTVKNHMCQHPAQAVGQRPDPGRRVRHAPGLDPDAGGLNEPRSRHGDARATPTAGRRRRPRTGPPCAVVGLRERLGEDVAVLDRELGEIESLAQQARAEALRHEAKRTAAAERVKAYGTSAEPQLADMVDLNHQLVTMTKRAALMMQAQVDVLEGKAKVLHRYRDGMVELAADLEEPIARRGRTADRSVTSAVVRPGDAGAGRGAAVAIRPPAVSRIVLGAQEDLRREIARAMHDGPAQSLTNIVLQAQIVERLLARDPASAQAEVEQLMSMVQQTLDATKSFIFDVRPMVLDDLGLVPTLRRAARERGRRAQIPVDFESLGHGPAAADGARERPVPDARRDAGGLPRRPTRTGWSIRPRLGRRASRRGSPARRGTPATSATRHGGASERVTAAKPRGAGGKARPASARRCPPRSPR